MAGLNTAPQRPVLVAGETTNARYSLKGKLDSGELATGTPTITEETTSDLTITNKAINSSTLTINDDTAVLAGQAAIWTTTGQLLATREYTLKITFTTDASQTRTIFARYIVGSS